MKKLLYSLSGFGLIAMLLTAGCSSGTGSGGGTTTAGAASLNAAASQTVTDGGIRVQGTGVTKIQPDVAQIRLGVQVLAETAQSAQSQAATQMDKVMAALKANGIADENIKTVEYNISPRRDYNQGREIDRGYQVSNIVLVTVKDQSKMGKVVDSATAAGANRVDSISFTAADQSAAQKKARELAVADAKAKAEDLAKLAGVKLGKPVAIAENVSLPVPMMRDTLSASDAQPATPISPGEMSVTIQVSMQFAIE